MPLDDRRAADGLEPDHQGEKAASVIGRLRAWLGRGRVAAAAAPQPELPPPPILARGTRADSVRTSRARLDRRAPRCRQRCIRRCPPTTDLGAAPQQYPAQAAAIIAAADRVMRHEFDLLGSGPFVPVDPGRDRRAAAIGRSIGISIRCSGCGFPSASRIGEWNLLEMRPGLADVKFPWELGRCQHWVPLAQAFRITGDARYATEVFDQHDDFMEANPVGLGVNWTCTMDVAIRAFNWAIALELDSIAARSTDAGSRDQPVCVDLRSRPFHRAQPREQVRGHQQPLPQQRRRLVRRRRCCFATCRPAQRWIARCREWLEQEIRVQVLDDGADYESSVPYHRLVAELFLSGARLAQLDGAPLSDEYLATAALDGRVPRCGASARWTCCRRSAMPMTAVFTSSRTTADGSRRMRRHLLAPAAAMFDEPQWWRADDDVGRLGSGVVGVRHRRRRRRRVQTARSPQLFPDAGLAVAKDRPQLSAGQQRQGRHQRIRQSQAQRSAVVRVSRPRPPR